MELFGFGADTGIDLPFEFDGRVPTNELKKQLAEIGVLGEERGHDDAARRRAAAGDRPGPAVGDAAAAGRRLRDVRQRRLRRSRPTSCRRSWHPRRPTADPGRRRPRPGQGRRSRSRRPSRPIPMPAEVRDPIERRPPPEHHRPAAWDGHSTTAEELFADYPADAIPVAGKTGTAQGASNYPWNDSSVFTAYSIDPDPPVHRHAVPREVGLRLGGRGARRQVHVPGAVGRSRRSTRSVLAEPLDTTSDSAGQGPPEGRRPTRRARTPSSVTPARRHGRQGLTTGWRSRCCSASPTAGSATSARARPTRAATSTGCCCWPRLVLDRRRLLHRLLGVAHPHRADPYTFVTRQVIFAIVAAVVMVDRDVRRLRVVEGAGPHALRASPSSPCSCCCRLQPGVGHHDADLVRPRPDQDPAGRVGQVHRAAGDVRLPREERTPARGQLPAVPRRPDHRRRCRPC